MPKNLPALPNQDKRLAEVLRLHSIINASAAQMAVAAAKCGLELKALKKEAGHGAWEDYFETHLARHGLSDRTARNYMRLADGLKGKALKSASVAVLELLDSAPSALKPAEQEKLTKAVAKMTDGATLSELYQEMGIAKKPQGSAAKGGKLKKGDKDDDESEEPVMTEAEGRRLRVTALITTLTEAIADEPWNAGTVDQRSELHGLLVDCAAKVGSTLKK
jgi:hypothetical protein